MTGKTTNNKRQRTQRTERILAIVAIVSIVIAWFVGAQLEGQDVLPRVQAALPEATRFERVDATTFAAYATNSPEELIGYVSIGTAIGYGGPMDVAVAVNEAGEVIGVEVASHKETPSFLQRVLDSDLVESLLGKQWQDAFQLGDDVDGVTGATYSSRAIADAVRSGSQHVAATQLGEEVPVEPPPSIQIGLPEIAIVALYAAGFIGHQRKFKYKKQLRWATMIVGMIVLGFMFNRPVSLVNINQLLLGYFPVWQTNLYWYLLLGGILFVFTVDNQNPYCSWFCPFGAAQECLGAIGGAKVRSVGRYRGLLFVSIVAVITIFLQKRLPYMTMMVFTGVLIAAVLVIMLGKTARVMQVVGWLTITPITGISVPYWLGQWFGVYATWEGVLLQGAAVVFVIGSYYFAEYRKKARRQEAKAQQSA